MKTIKTIICSIMLLVAFSGCEKDGIHNPIEKNKNAPGPVSNVQTKSIAGGAIISYALPNDGDLLYVKASYTEKGMRREFKASYYTNVLTVDGLSREEEYVVDLVAVNRSGVESETVSVKINPLTPPIIGVFQTLEGKATFGGITISYKNPSGAAIAIGVLTTDEKGGFYEHDTFYSSQPSPKFSVRGFASDEREFKVYVRDKWENTSDTLSFTVMPIAEVELDKSLFRELRLRGDADVTSWEGQMRYIWDGRIVGDDQREWGLHTGNSAVGYPMFFTFDLGAEATLSRFKLWHQQTEKHMFNDVSPRNYEVWGRIEPILTGDNGAFEPYWKKLGEIENIKPSGLPVGSLSDDDRSVIRNGDELVFEEEQYTVRYIRIRCLKNWSGNTNMTFTEVSFWATEIKNVAQ